MISGEYTEQGWIRLRLNRPADLLGKFDIFGIEFSLKAILLLHGSSIIDFKYEPFSNDENTIYIGFKVPNNQITTEYIEKLLQTAKILEALNG